VDIGPEVRLAADEHDLAGAEGREALRDAQRLLGRQLLRASWAGARSAVLAGWSHFIVTSHTT
jgi:hypothetical protein